MKNALLLIAMIGCTVVANLLLKSGAIEGTTDGYLQKFLNWRTILGLGTFASAALIYVLLLNRMPLNVVQSFAAAQFIAVILAAAVILREPVPPIQWVGIGLIALGIATIGWLR